MHGLSALDRWLIALALLGLTLMIVVVMSWPAAAQSNVAGTIDGTLCDAQGRVIPGGTIAVHDLSNRFERSTTADAAGHFRMAGLPAGTYVVAVQARGFAPWRDNGVIVEAARVTDLRPMLRVGGPQQTVVVDSDAARINTTTPEVSTNIDQISINELPSNGRRWSNFALLTPGVVDDASGYGLLSFRGISVLLNNSTIDGADNNQAFFSEERGRTRIGYSTTQAAVREFQVNTSNFSAEYGRAAGGVVNTVTKTGGSVLHGNLFFYDRDNEWGATNPFTTLTRQDGAGGYVTSPFRPRDRRLQWGVDVGGPIRKDKLFWFFAYDQYQRNFPGVARTENAQQLFAPPSNAKIQMLAARTNTTPAAALAAYNNVLGGLNSLLGEVPRTGNQVILFPKLDWQVNERNHLTLEYNRMRWNSPGGVQTGASETYGLSSFGNDYVKGDWGIAHWSTFLTANLMNEVRYQYGRDFESEYAQAPSLFEQPMSRNIWQQPPQVSLARGNGGFTLGKPAFLNRPAFPDERRYQASDTLNWAHGNHMVKAGYDLDFVTDYTNNLYNGTGSYSYSNVLSFASDLLAPNHCDAGGQGLGNLPCYSHFSQSVGPAVFQFQSADYAGYASDEWKLRHGLTLSFGMRYEYEQLPRTNRALVNPDIPATADLPHDRNNFGPRVGIAWDLDGKARTVVRAGFGTYYGRIINSTALSALTNTGAATSQRSYFFRPLDVGAPPFPYSFGSKPQIAVAPNATFFDKDFQNPQIHQTELSVERQVGHDTQVSVSYLGSYGRELPGFIDTNINLAGVRNVTYEIVDTTGMGPLQGSYTTPFYTERLRNDYQQITDIFSETNSAYHAGLVKLSHRMAGNFHLHASYTYAHAIDYNQNASTFADANDVLDPVNFKLERGNSNFDVRHRFTGSAYLRAPWKLKGWRGLAANGYSLSPIATLQTGLPYTMRTGGSVPSIQCTYAQFLNGICPSTVISGIGPGINGSGGDNRIAQVGRNTFRYPSRYNFDIRMAKRTNLNDRLKLDVMAEVFNVMNHQNVTSVETIGYLIDGASSPADLPRLTYMGTNTKRYFGLVTNSNSTTLYRERQVQLAMRFSF
jgi:hypothetical protein